MARKKRAPLIASTRAAEYAHMSDADVSEAYLRVRAVRRELYAESDGEASVHPEHSIAWDMLDSQGFALDDELCARDMDLPKKEG